MTGNNREQIALKVTFIMLLLRAFTARALLPSNLPRKPLAPCLLPSTPLTIRNTQPPQRLVGLQIPLRKFSSLFIFPVFQPPPIYPPRYEKSQVSFPKPISITITIIINRPINHNALQENAPCTRRIRFPRVSNST